MKHENPNILIAGRDKVKPSQSYVSITIQMKQDYDQFLVENLENEFLEELIYNMGSGDIYNYQFYEGCVSFCAHVPLRAAKRLLEANFLKETGQNPDSQAVKDLESFMKKFSITCIFSPDLKTDDSTGKSSISSELLQNKKVLV